MMMNFLDLSAASDEERRLISEILSDTSVVNFAEPLVDKKQQVNINHQQPQSSKSNSTTYLPGQHQQQYHQNQQPQHNSNQIAPVASSRAHHPNDNPTIQANSIHKVPSVVPTAKSLNYAKNNYADISNNQVKDNNVDIVRNTSARNSNTLSTATTTPGGLSTNCDSIHSNNLIVNNNSSGNSIRNQTLATQDNSVTSTHHNSLQSTSNNNNSNINQIASVVPPPHQVVATQVPPIMAGDMNSVINIDMASTQPPGFAIQPPPPTHVSSYPPAAAHHVYSGPPIYHHHPTAYPYLLSYLPYHHMPYVMPPNSVVPRQQVPQQSNQPSNTNMNSHNRSHSHHNRTNKVKDALRQQHIQHHHHQHQPTQHDYRNNTDMVRKNVDTQKQSIPPCNNDPGVIQINNSVDSKQEFSHTNTNQVSNMSEKKVVTQNLQHQDVAKTDQEISGKETNEDEMIKVSSDEGFDTQSSLDVSKQSHESTPPTSNPSKSPGESNNSIVEGTAQVPLQSSETGKDQVSSSSEKNQTGSCSSASKSWASLFKGNRTSLLGPSMNGEVEHVDSENSDEESRILHASGSIENVVKNSNASCVSKELRSQEVARRALDKMAPRLAQRINSINLKHSLPLLRPRGFINKGNGCYINSTLQALIACPPFYNLMKEIGDLRDASKKSKQIVPSDQKMQMNYLQAEALEPKCIYNVLGKIKSECLKGAQEDAEEFLSSVLNGLHEEMISLSETLQSSQLNSSSQNGHSTDTEEMNGDANNDDNLWREVGPKNRSLPIRTAPVVNTPIQEIFGGSLFSIRTAGKDRCGHRSPFFDLQLDISGDNVRSLQDAIKSFTATETIQDFYCSKTKQKLDAQRRTSLDQLPPILILHLKQFVYTQDHGLRKLMKKIEYPIDFELPDSCLHDKNTDKSLRNSRTYKLLAVVYHEGKEAYKGHYLTDVYHIGSSQWIRCDDSNLKVVPLPRIENPDSSRTPYLLFYRRLNTLGPTQSNRYDNKKKN